MLWNSIYYFFIRNIFGGLYYDGETYYTGKAIFNVRLQNNLPLVDWTSEAPIDIFGASMPLGNYLSLIATIITMVIIVTLCALFIKKIVSLVGGLIR